MMEDSQDFSPFYHTYQDKLSHISIPYLTAAARAAAAAAALIAGAPKQG
jgi:hypothetical protein